MKSLVIALATVCTILVVPTLTNAQERVSVDVNYVGGGFTSAFDYPKEATFSSGKIYDTNGLGIATKVAITDVVSVNGRYEHATPRNAQFFTEDTSRVGRRGIIGRQTESDREAAGGGVGYWEVSGSFKLPKTHGHSLVIGVAEAKLNRSFASAYEGESGTLEKFSFALHASHVGFVVGGEGKQKFGDVTFDYAGRLYPNMARKDYQSAVEETYHSSDSSSFGCELRGTATWMVAKHIGLTGGYEFRRLRTEGPDSSWPINENQTTASVVVGTRLSF